MDTLERGLESIERTTRATIKKLPPNPAEPEKVRETNAGTIGKLNGKLKAN